MPPSLNVKPNPIEIDELLANTRPEYWFPTLYRYAPMGVKNRAMMTLLSSKASEANVDDKKFHFFQKPWNQRDCVVLDSYNGPGLTNATAAASSSGVERIIAMTAQNVKLWQVGMHVVITKFADSAYKQVVSEAKGKVTGKTVGSDTTSYLTITLTQADSDDALSGTYLRANPAGQSHPDVHVLPDSVLEQGTEYTGACSTFLGSYSMNDIIRKTKLRYNVDLWLEAQQDGLKDFAIDKEMAFLHSVLSTSNPEETVTGGMEYYIQQHQAQSGQNIIDALTDSIYLGTKTGPAYSWIYELLAGVMEFASRWSGNDEMSVFHGGQVGLVINEMIRDKGVYNLGQTTGTDEFGFKFTRLTFQNGSLKFYQHPLFTNAPKYAGMMVIPNFANIKTAVFSPFETIDADTMNEAGRKRDGNNWSSVAKGGFREICGWKFEGIDGMFIIKNVRPDLNRT